MTVLSVNLQDCLPDHLLVSLSSELKKSVILETLSKSNVSVFVYTFFF